MIFFTLLREMITFEEKNSILKWKNKQRVEIWCFLELIRNATNPKKGSGRNYNVLRQKVLMCLGLLTRFFLCGSFMSYTIFRRDLYTFMFDISNGNEWEHRRRWSTKSLFEGVKTK